MPHLPAKPKSPERRAAEVFGRRGELLAAWYLRLKGYRIRAVRAKTPMGEIDLVAERFGATVFVEVKARRTASEAEALEAVNVRRIVRAAEYYLSRNPRLAGRDMRFDVILLAPFRLPRHLMNAFDAN